jgi:DNA processing protein
LSGLLDRDPPWRYLQRLGMLSFAGHNRPKTLPKRADVPCAMSTVSLSDPVYPTRLRQLERVPSRLWYSGRLPAEGERGIAIVGSRAATSGGCGRASGIASSLARAGYFVVSGGALGIDAAAHRGALEADGVTFAVLGCGVDVLYPDRHRQLFDRIAVRGGLLSEYPPGSPPRPGCFPVRNRIVAALAEAVVVVEARPSSGALITARLAWEQGRILAAVPGTAGTDQLIASGLATSIESGDDLMRRLAGEIVARPSAPASIAPLLAVLGSRPDSAAGIAQRMGVSLPAALGMLAEAELSGWIRRLAGGRYEVPRGH